MKQLKIDDNVFISKLQKFARVLEVDNNSIKVSYYNNIWDNHTQVIQSFNRDELKLFGDTTKTKKAKGTKRTAKAKYQPSTKELNNVLELIDL